MALAAVADAVASLLHPWLFMGRALCYLPPTLLRLLRARQWAVLARWGRVRQAWFGAFWRWAGPQVRAGGEAVVVPLLQGRVRRGRVIEVDSDKKRKSLPPPVGGTVVEVGPGSGMWVGAIAAAAASAGSSSNSSRKSRRKSASGIAKIYGVEPNPAVHDSLRAAAAAAGLAAVYEIVPAGLEDVAAGRGPVAPGSIDCVVCVLCLCGIPAPAANIRALYALLKPGGRLYVYEHVRATRSRFIQLHQFLVNLVWPAVMGGCHLRRDTERLLRDAGPWAAVDLAQPVAEPWYHTIPHVVGVLTK